MTKNDWLAYAVFSHAEVQQLREVLRKEISELEAKSAMYKETAIFWKSETSGEGTEVDWYLQHHKARAKIKKLAALQSKLKSFDALY